MEADPDFRDRVSIELLPPSDYNVINTTEKDLTALEDRTLTRARSDLMKIPEEEWSRLVEQAASDS